MKELADRFGFLSRETVEDFHFTRRKHFDAEQKAVGPDTVR